MEMINGYGPHLVLDLADCNFTTLNSIDECFKFLYTLPEIIGMTKITQPYVFRYPGKFPEDGGITGMVIIAESHISVHTYPLKGYAFVDVFSCKNFDVEKTKNYVINFFTCKNPISSITYRGEYFKH